MSSTKPNSTACVLLLGLPPSILCGIDLLSFTTSSNFRGIKDVPAGFHFIFTSETSSLSLRDGFWFRVPSEPVSGPAPLLVWKWDTSSSTLRRATDPESYRAHAAESWERNLSPYRQSVKQDGEDAVPEIDWAGLTGFISPAQLTHLTRSEEWNISSASSMPEDRDDIPGLKPEETGLEEHELGSLGIDLKRSWREGAVGRERTEGAMDRSWALEHVASRWQEGGSGSSARWGSTILGQMQVCFLMLLTVANYSCLEEWKRCLELALTSKKAVNTRQEWFVTFLELLRRQMTRCEDVEGGLFDMSDEGGGLLKKWLVIFKRTLAQAFEGTEGNAVKREMGDLEDELKEMYGWDLSDDFVRRGVVQLEDGELVEVEVGDMHEEDEDGEYAPVVVDLGNS